jgi:hypothetical protein
MIRNHGTLKESGIAPMAKQGTPGSLVNVTMRLSATVTMLPPAPALQDRPLWGLRLRQRHHWRLALHLMGTRRDRKISTGGANSNLAAKIWVPTGTRCCLIAAAP